MTTLYLCHTRNQDLWSFLVLEFEIWHCRMNRMLCAKVFLASNSLHNLGGHKNNHDQFIATKFSVGCMVWPWSCLFQSKLPVKILIRLDVLALVSSAKIRDHTYKINFYLLYIHLSTNHMPIWHLNQRTVLYCNR